jgi:hypothetical protein
VVALGLLALVGIIIAFGKLMGGPNPVTPGADPPAARSTVDPSTGNDGVANPDEPTPSAFRPSTGPDVVAVANAFAKSWVQHKRSAKAWRDSLLPHCTKTLAAELDGVDPAGVPADRITGPATVEVRAEAYADVIIPIDAGRLRLRLVAPADETGKRRWLVDAIDWERA